MTRRELTPKQARQSGHTYEPGTEPDLPTDPLEACREEVRRAVAAVFPGRSFDPDAVADETGVEHDTAMLAGIAASEAKGRWKEAEKHLADGRFDYALRAAFLAGRACSDVWRRLHDQVVTERAAAAVANRAAKNRSTLTGQERAALGKRVAAKIAALVEHGDTENEAREIAYRLIGKETGLAKERLRYYANPYRPYRHNGEGSQP